jgi:hypothetical protein
VRLLSLICALLLLASCPVPAAQFTAVRTLTCPAGRVADAAADAEGRVYLCYPDAGYVAQFDRAGKLLQNIRREAGVNRPFKPTSISVGRDGMLQVFDEVSRELLVIGNDGNQLRSFPLAYPDGAQPVALSRIGHIALDEAEGVWALLPDRAVLASFDDKGAYVRKLSLDALAQYAAATFSRCQWEGGKLFLLDFNQGAVLYGQPEPGKLRRLLLSKPKDIDAAPQAQDFAVDGAGRVLLLTTNRDDPALLLSPGASGYASSFVDLPAGLVGKRLGCRAAPGGYIVWNREGGIVCLCTP